MCSLLGCILQKFPLGSTGSPPCPVTGLLLLYPSLASAAHQPPWLSNIKVSSPFLIPCSAEGQCSLLSCHCTPSATLMQRGVLSSCHQCPVLGDAALPKRGRIKPWSAAEKHPGTVWQRKLHQQVTHSHSCILLGQVSHAPC